MMTSPKIVFLIIISLAFYALAGLASTVFLIVHKADAALIAVVAGQAGTALGGLLSTLNNTRTQANPAANLSTEPIKTEIVQPVNSPVPVQETTTESKLTETSTEGKK